MLQAKVGIPSDSERYYTDSSLILTYAVQSTVVVRFTEPNDRPIPSEHPSAECAA